MALGIGAGTGQDGIGHIALVPERVGAAKQARGAQGQLVGVGAGQADGFELAGRGGVGGSIEPARNILPIMRRERIERPALAERPIDRAPPVATIRPARAHCPPRRRQPAGNRPQPRRQQCLQPLPQRLGQPRRRAAGADSDHHRIAFDDGGRGEIAQLRPVDDIDQQPARLEPRRRRISLRALQRNDRDGGVRRLIVGQHRPRPLQQAPLGLGRLTLTQQNNRPPGQPEEDGEAMHCILPLGGAPYPPRNSGSRSAATVAAAGIRSATTAH